VDTKATANETSYFALYKFFRYRAMHLERQVLNSGSTPFTRLSTASTQAETTCMCGMGEPKRAEPKRVLIVDDHAAIRRAVTRVLESQPNVAVCGEAENGRVAIDQAQRLKPDLIVLDFSMPVMNGLEAARILRQRMPKVPILMYTSFATSDLAEEALAAGVSRVATKSTPPALIEDLQMLLENAT
jgi:CheY-like chemotaxis protein